MSTNVESREAFNEWWNTTYSSKVGPVWLSVDEFRYGIWLAGVRAALAAQAPVIPAAARDVLSERRRQVDAEGWTPEHDDEHEGEELGKAAVAYLLTAGECWPWEITSWKPTGRRSNLVKAGALVLAEIERLDRASTSTSTPAMGGEA